MRSEKLAAIPLQEEEPPTENSEKILDVFPHLGKIHKPGVPSGGLADYFKEKEMADNPQNKDQTGEKADKDRKKVKAIMFVADPDEGNPKDLDVEVVAVEPDVMSAIVARRC